MEYGYHYKYNMNYDFSLFYQYNDEMEVYLNHDEELDFSDFKLDILKGKLWSFLTCIKPFYHGSGSIIGIF